MAVPITSPTPTPLFASFEKRQSAHASLGTSEPILEVLAGSAADILKERASSGDSFDSLLCATLKALKGENPTTFTSLLQSCTSLIDSGSHGRMKALKGRGVVDDRGDFLANVKAVNHESGEATLDRSETYLVEEHDPATDGVVEKRQDEGFDSILTPL